MYGIVYKTVESIGKCFYHCFVFSVEGSIGNDTDPCFLFKSYHEVVDKRIVFSTHSLNSRTVVYVFYGRKFTFILLLQKSSKKHKRCPAFKIEIFAYIFFQNKG